MKNLIFQVHIDTDVKSTEYTHDAGYAQYTKLLNFSRIRAKEYATKYKADYVCITDDKHFPGWTPSWQRMAMFSDDFAEYDNILYLDTDVVFTAYAPNIFKLMSFYNHDFFAAIDHDTMPIRTEAGHFNAGVIAAKRSWLDLWSPRVIKKKMEKWNNVGVLDQCCLNEMVKETRNQYVNLKREWNMFPSYTSFLPSMGIDRSKITQVIIHHYAYAIHYTHYHRENFKIEPLLSHEDSVKYNMRTKNEKTPFEEEIHTFPRWWQEYSKSIVDLEKSEKYSGVGNQSLATVLGRRG